MNSSLSELFIPTLFIFLSYCIGSFPTGFLYSKWVHKIDIRSLGSGNSGATNVGRNFGLKAAVIVTIVDVLKGLVPVLVAKQWYPNHSAIIILVAMACVIGHAYPVWAGFRGGKIVATSVGVLIAFDIWLAIVMVAMFALILFVTSTVSLASITSYSITAIYIALTNPDWIYKIGFLLIAAFLIYRHRENLLRILNNSESKINWGLHSRR